jgi:hypothetical protein
MGSGSLLPVGRSIRLWPQPRGFEWSTTAPELAFLISWRKQCRTARSGYGLLAEPLSMVGRLRSAWAVLRCDTSKTIASNACCIISHYFPHMIEPRWQTKGKSRWLGKTYAGSLEALRVARPEAVSLTRTQLTGPHV